MRRKALAPLATAAGGAFGSGPTVVAAGAHGTEHRHHEERHITRRQGHSHRSDDRRSNRHADHRSDHRSDQQKSDRPTSNHEESNTPSSPECGNGPVSDQDREFLMTSIEGDHFEITGGQMAQERGVDPSTKDLGARLVADHSKSLADATALAEKLGVPVPSTMSEKQQEELAHVAQHQGLEFDDEYAELEVTDHQQDIADATKEVQDGCNTEVRDNARNEIPVLQAHLDMSQHVHDVIEATPDHDRSGSDSDEPSSPECGNGP